MKTFTAILFSILNIACFSQKVSDTTFISIYEKDDNLTLTKRFMNQIPDVKSVELIDENNVLTYNLIWIKKTSYDRTESKEIVEVDVRMKFVFTIEEYNIRIEANAIDFLNKNKSAIQVQNDPLALEILNNHVQLFFRTFKNFIDTKNPRENEAITESVDILMKAENQQDVAVGIWLGSGIISAFVLRKNPTAALIISGIGGVSGLVIYVSSRINKRKGLKKLKEAA